MAGVAVGGTIAVAALVGGPVSGASLNPARSFAPALVTLDFQYIWIYFAGPLFGVLCTSPFCRIIQREECCTNENVLR